MDDAGENVAGNTVSPHFISSPVGGGRLSGIGGTRRDNGGARPHGGACKVHVAAAGLEIVRGSGLKAERSRIAAGVCRAVSAALLASALASCTSASGDAQFDIQSPGFAGNGAAVAAVDTEAGSSPVAAAGDGDQTDFADASSLPASTGARPDAKPAAVAGETANLTAAEDGAVAADIAKQADVAAKPAADAVPGPSGIAAATPPNLIDEKKRTFLSSFFGSSETPARPLAAAGASRPLVADTAPAAVAAEPAASKPRPIIKLASADAGEVRTANASLAFGDDNALPGVRQTMLFEIKRKSGIDDDSDVDVHEEDDLGPIQVASAAGMARLAPNGLLKQNDTVDTACLKPALVRTLKIAEQHFGSKAVITSGYRDADRNRRARGAKNSMHMYCAAADVQMPGVTKWELANYFRTLPGRGGVGTYCHTDSVHVDIGPERDWNWRCGRRR